MDKPLRCWLVDSQRDQKSPLRRCFKPRPPLSAGCARFASGCRSRSEALNFEPQATVRPLVRMPTDRHTATGTCEFGRAAHRANRNALQEKNDMKRKFFCRARLERARGASRMHLG